jgi:hypothetical protein
MPTFDSTSDDRIVNNTLRHRYRVLTDHEKQSVQSIKDRGLEMMATVETCVPVGREASLAKTKIEEAVMWACKGVTR